MNFAACPDIAGMRIENLIEFMNKHNLEVFLPCDTRTGKPPKYDRQWLMNVNFLDLSLTNYQKQVAHSLKKDDFRKLRKKAMEERKERFEKTQ